MSRTVAEYTIGEVYATDEEIATFLDIAITLLHSRSIRRATGACDIDIEKAKANPRWMIGELNRHTMLIDDDEPIVDEMNRVLGKLSGHPVEGWSLRFVRTAS